jgi:hypothetical protein
MVLGALALIALMLQGVIDQLIYYPMRYPQGAWDLQAESGAKDQWLTAADGTQLHCWWFPKADAHFVTLFLHGNAGNVTHRVDHADAVMNAGSAFLVLDYRGYGKSKGRPSERGLYNDADAAYARLIELGYSPDCIIVQGESLGSAVAANLAMRRKCAAVILESPLMSASKVAETVLPLIVPLMIRGYDTYRMISQINVPVFVIHGDADEIVPFSQGRAVFGAAHEPKYFWAVHGAHHNDLLEVAGSEYVTRLREFYQVVIQNATH